MPTYKRKLKRILKHDATSAILLLGMAIIALIWANSPWAFIHAKLSNSFLFVINEGLMALFFLAVGLELKRGVIEGDLAKPSQIALPGIAALGGMLIPALIYISINFHHPETLKAWATPVATDIAFALGVLTLFDKRVPRSLKLFLLALAIFDDIGAILIITIFYSAALSYLYLLLALTLTGILFLLNNKNVKTLWPYLTVGILLWLSLIPSGIHPTIGGVVLAFFIPDDVPHKKSSLHILEDALKPWVAFVILPLFALANAGFAIDNLNWNVLSSRVVLGIVFGLFFGKQIGVLFFSYIIIRLRWARLPRGSSWLAMYGVSLLCGIGFTMSLFLGTLSFQNEINYLAQVRIGVIVGSLLSGIVGALILRRALHQLPVAKHNEPMKGGIALGNK